MTNLKFTSLIETTGVTVQYGAKVALQNISLNFLAGKRVAIVGPNGAGKSTLLKLIAGEIQPSLGEVSFCGFESDAHLSIAYVPQHKQIDWNFPVTVEEVVMMGRIGRIGLFRRPRQRDRDLVQQSLTQVGMSHLAKTRIGSLSGGQQQRVFIARALAQEATMLLLDEPLSSLDIPSRQSVLEVLEEVSNSGVTIVMVTHDLTIAQQHFDEIVLLNKELVAAGPAEKTLTADTLRHAYSGHLYSMTPNLQPETH
ncbi:MAG: metal ABC transporter ATP-binding protein [Chloroflexota bacterium]